MLNGKRIMVVMPAFRAAKTVEATYRGLPHGIVDKVLLVDDASNDKTSEIAKRVATYRTTRVRDDLGTDPGVYYQNI